MDYSELLDESVLNKVDNTVETDQNENNAISNGTKIWGLFNQKCMQRFFNEFDFDRTCFTQLVAEATSLMIMLGSLLVKIPQIFLVLKAKNVKGLSEASFVIEVLGGSLYVAYNIIEQHPFMTWGECAFVVVQNIILVLLFWLYADDKDEQFSFFQRFLFSTFFFCFMFFVLTFDLPSVVVAALGLSPVPISIIGRLPQIVKNYQQKHTGNLSLITTFLMFAGNVARLFTIAAQVPDPIMLISTAAACASLGIPFVQILYYRKNTGRVFAAEEAKKKK